MKILKTTTYFFIILFLLSNILTFQITLIFGLFLDVFYFLLIGAIALGLSILFFIKRLEKNLQALLPFIILFFGYILTLFLNDYNVSFKLHYYLNKNSFENAERIIKNKNLKTLNDIENYINYSKIKSNIITQYQTKFSDNTNIISKKDLHLLNQSLNEINAINFISSKNYMMFTVNGFLDNESGYIKFYGNVPKLGKYLENTGLKIISLKHISDKWYYYVTT